MMMKQLDEYSIGKDYRGRDEILDVGRSACNLSEDNAEVGAKLTVSNGKRIRGSERR